MCSHLIYIFLFQLPEPPDSPLPRPSQSEEETAPLASEEPTFLTDETYSSTPPEEEDEELPLSSDEEEEPHVLLAALATITTAAPESSLDIERDTSSPLPCQLLIPE